MLKGSLKKPVFILKGGVERPLVKMWKTLFYGVSEIASSVDWSITYAYYSPKPPKEEEWKLFTKKLEDLRNECKVFYSAVSSEKRKEVVTLLERLANMEEEFQSYPFSDRLQFFLNRLEFFKKLLRTAA